MLTTRFVSTVTVTKRTDYPDDKIPGLVLRVTPNGAKSWCLRYRDKAGRQTRYTLGRVADLPLPKARKEASKKLHAIAAGVDPMAERREHRDARTISALCKDFLDDRAKTMRPSTQRQDALILRLHVLAHWKHRRARDITRIDVRDRLKPLVSEGKGVMANQVLATIRKLFNFGIKRDWVEANPAAKMDPPHKDVSRDRVLSDEEIRLFWKLCDQEPPLIATFMRLRLLTAQRGWEIANLKWADFESDAYGATFTIPAEIAKNGHAHRVPLTKTAKDLIDQLPRVNEWVFPGRSGRLARSIWENAGGRIQDRMTVVLRLSDPSATADFRGHDLRRTAATKMASLGIPSSHISKVLNHIERGPRATPIYLRYEFDKEKRIALEALERELLRILSEQPKSGTVLPMAR